MKSMLACIVLVAVFGQLQAAPHASDSPYNYDDSWKKAADLLGEWTKKIEEITGIHSEFDKEKFLKASKGLLEKLGETQAKMKEAVEANLKNVPSGEEMKKKIEEVQKLITDALKTLNSPDVQKSYEKMRDTIHTSYKKIYESCNEVAQKLGIAPPQGMQKAMSELAEEMSKSIKGCQEKVAKIIEEATNEMKKKKA